MHLSLSFVHANKRGHFSIRYSRLRQHYLIHAMQLTKGHLNCSVAMLLWPVLLFANADSPTAQACSSESGLYVSAATGNIRQARAGSLPVPAAITSGERQLAMGLSPSASFNGCAAIGLDYEYTRYEFTAINSRDRDLHRLQLPIAWTQDSAMQRLTAVVVPGIATSSNVMKDLLNRGARDDLFLTARFERQPAKGRWGPLLGITYDRTFGRDKLSPVFGVQYRPTGSSSLRLARFAYPDSRLAFALSDKQHLIWRLFPSGQRWHVVTDDFASSFEYRVEGWRTQLNWQFSVAGQWALELMGGYEFSRRHWFADDAGASIDSSIENAWTFGIALRFGDAPIISPHGVDHLH